MGFTTRMGVQALTHLPVLPRGTYGKADDFDLRCDALRAAHRQWSKRPSDGKPPPLILPRGEAETSKMFAARLEVAVIPSACRVVLPQGGRESEAHATRRLKVQRQCEDCLLPHDPTAESDEQFEERLAAAEPVGHVRGSMTLIGSRLSSALTRVSAAARYSQVRSSTSSEKKGKDKVVADAGVWRPE